MGILLRSFRCACLVPAVLVLMAAASREAQASDGVRAAGDILQFALPVTAAALTLGYRDGAGALELGESEAVTLGATYGLKYAVNERRPNGGRQSFPSGHTSISFSAAEFMRKRYGLEYGIPAYALASFVAYSRVESKEHYAHDVIAGAAIGIVSSYIFTKPYRGWQIRIDADTRHGGVSLTREW